MRLTAVVQSDDRVTYLAAKQETSGSSRTITRTRRDGRFRWVKRHSSSAYAGDGTGVIRDDSDDDGPMERFAGQLRIEREPLMNGISTSLAWIDWRYHPGDRLDTVSGRGIELNTGSASSQNHPVIERVTYDFRGQRTHLSLNPRGR